MNVYKRKRFGVHSNTFKAYSYDLSFASPARRFLIHNGNLKQSSGNKYLSHYNNIIKPYFPDCNIHEVGGAKLAEFIKAFLGGAGEHPERKKTTM